MSKELIYLDNAASTRLDERVVEAMKPYFFETYAVATSEFAYSLGIEAREALDEAREKIATKLGGKKEELVFTSGGTEASNLAIKGVVEAQKDKGKHLIVSKLEDFPVLNSAKSLERKGFEVTYLEVDKHGIVNIDQLEETIKEETILVSIQHANQEIGTLQDIKTIAEICKEQGAIFHTDATHTFSRVPLDVSKIPVDLVTLSAHTIHGPKGIGALYVRKGTPIKKQIDGGFQESNLRAGVENIPGAVGFAKAVELVTEEENKQLKEMRDELIKQVQTKVPNTTLNGHPSQRTPQNANITFHQVEGESITLHLDMKGFAVSTGSACFSKSLEASHVIMGIGGDHERAHGSLRFTFGRYNKKEDVKATVDAVAEVVEKLREISPLTE
ncbi:MAG: aminotransferase class V-fold PLP-dependent enzyme [Candidatus Heimdallarchaeota archaeon]|nr:aminotransferase class V-fold PLP-dependent enzyme [Candidatus Heimdallarchaeota archaeon]